MKAQSDAMPDEIDTDGPHEHDLIPIFIDKAVAQKVGMVAEKKGLNTGEAINFAIIEFIMKYE